MQIERAVMVVGIGIRDSRFDMRVPVGSDGRRLIHIQSVVVDQRDDPRHLRDHEECQQAMRGGSGSFAANVIAL